MSVRLEAALPSEPVLSRGRLLLGSLGVGFGALVSLLAAPAFAAFNAIGSQGVGNLVGGASTSTGACSDTAHATQSACETASETWTVTSTADTGIYEIVANQELLIFAIVTMVMASAGFMLFRTWLRRGRG